MSEADVGAERAEEFRREVDRGIAEAEGLGHERERVGKVLKEAKVDPEELEEVLSMIGIWGARSPQLAGTFEKRYGEALRTVESELGVKPARGGEGGK